MSQINDALKRASQTDQRHAATGGLPPPIAAPESQPAEHPSPSNPLLPVAILLVAAASAFVLWRVFFARRQISPTLPAPPIAHAAPVPSSVSAPSPQPAKAPLAPIVVPPPAPLPVAVQPPPSLAPKPAVPVGPSFPELKLTAILFSKTNPRALINGDPVGIGDEINGAHVTAIAADQVTVTWNGQTRTLRLAD